MVEKQAQNNKKERENYINTITTTNDNNKRQWKEVL